MKLNHSVTWTSPSNIALVKYWGKRPVQLAMNSSVSFTLKNLITKMHVDRLESANGLTLNFEFDGLANEKFSKKIFNFLNLLSNEFPWIQSSILNIRSTNTFPHSSGIASSASSMSCLVLCILSLDELITSKKRNPEDFFKLASYYSRIGSGSASRSLYAPVCSWGESAEYAVPVGDIHPYFQSFHDSILIVDEGEKLVSSTVGHSLMDNHIFKNERYVDAEKNHNKLIGTLQNGDFLSFSKIVEHEALSLHALMMTSEPSVILLKPDSLFIIQKIKEWRNKFNIDVTFTIDAGPNIHILYPESSREKVVSFLEQELWKNKKIIHDQLGQGPERISYGN